MRSIYFSADGSELLWKGKRGGYDIVPIRKLVGVSLDFPVDDAADATIAELRKNQLSFLLQFTHRNVMLAARSENERCMFVSGLLCLRDQAAGCTIGSDIWEDIAALLFQTLSPSQQQPCEQGAVVRKKRTSIVLGHSLLHSAARSTQQQRLVISKLQSAVSEHSADVSSTGLNDGIVKEMIMQRRIACAASDEIVVNFRVQLLKDGTVIVSRDAAAHKEEKTLEFLRSSFFDVSRGGVKSHVWMSQVRSVQQSARAVIDDCRLSNRLLGCTSAKVMTVLCLSCR
jgi:hypothetical protein